MGTKPFQLVIYLGLTMFSATLLSFGMKVYAASSLPCPDGFWDASVSFCTHRDYMYGYGIYADNSSTNNSSYGYGVTEDVTADMVDADSNVTDTGTIIVLPPDTTTETGETAIVDEDTTNCVLSKPRHLTTKHKSNGRKVILRWRVNSTNCIATAGAHYTIRIKTKGGKLVFVKRDIVETKYVLHIKRLRANKHYEFSVRAVVEDGTKTAWSKAKRIKL